MIRDRIKELRRVTASDLRPDPDNWRKHPPQQRAALQGILREIGYADALLARETPSGLMLIDGHLRADLDPDAEVPVLVVDLDEDEAHKLMATLDPLAAMAETDQAALESLLQRISTEEEAVSDLLASLATAEEATPPKEDPGPQIDRAEELQQAWGTEYGQLWQIGRHRLLCGDATSEADVERLMGGEKAVLMATDPPYLVDYQGGNHPESWSNKPEVKDKHWDDYHEGEGSEFFYQFLDVARKVALASNTAIYQWHAHRRQVLVEEAWHRAGLLVHQQIIWVKARPVLTRSHYMWQHEPCFYGWVEGYPPKRRPPNNATTVWQIDQQGESDGIHPTQKPRTLFTWPIEYHTEDGDVCYEPFSGSGTCLVAAEQLGRTCYALEIEPKYVAVTLQRMADMGLNCAQVTVYAE